MRGSGKLEFYRCEFRNVGIFLDKRGRPIWTLKRVGAFHSLSGHGKTTQKFNRLLYIQSIAVSIYDVRARVPFLFFILLISDQIGGLKKRRANRLSLYMCSHYFLFY